MISSHCPLIFIIFATLENANLDRVIKYIMLLQVTIAFNHFGVGLVQRMPRCRLGYFHIVNNDFTEWEMYAIGGSASPTIYSQGNRYTAPFDPSSKEVF